MKKTHKFQKTLKMLQNNLKVPLKQSGLNKIKSSLKRYILHCLLQRMPLHFFLIFRKQLEFGLQRLLGLSVLWLNYFGALQQFDMLCINNTFGYKKAKGFELLFGTVALLRMYLYCIFL